MIQLERAAFDRLVGDIVKIIDPYVELDNGVATDRAKTVLVRIGVSPTPPSKTRGRGPTMGGSVTGSVTKGD